MLFKGIIPVLVLFVPPCWADRELYAQLNSLSLVIQVVIPC